MWRDLISGKLSELEVRKQYQIEITKWFAPLENLNDSEDMNRAWENIKENIKTSAKEFPGLYKLKQHPVVWWRMFTIFRAKEAG